MNSQIAISVWLFRNQNEILMLPRCAELKCRARKQMRVASVSVALHSDHPYGYSEIRKKF